MLACCPEVAVEVTRCDWCGTDPRYVEYHDREWGVPVHDDVRLFELLTLEGAQAGLSWLTILKRREGYRRAFAGFDPGRVARFDRRRVDRLVADASIIRHRGKIEATVTNAGAVLAVINAFGSFDEYLWGFVDGVPVTNRWRSTAEMPAVTPQSVALSRDLKRRGFCFVGPTIGYAFMQAAGLVNDHVVNCFRHDEIAVLAG